MQTQIKTSSLSRPVVRRYLNIILFLNDYYRYRKSTEVKFSYEVWSSELGFKSKSSTRMICQGKRPVTEPMIEAICEAEHFSDLDRDYLQLLAYHYKVKSASLKKSIFEKILENFDLGEKQSQLHNYVKFLSHSQIPVIQVLISLKDFKSTVQNLSDVLSLSSNEVRNFLTTLEELDLVQKINSEKEDETYWISNNRLFRIPEEVADSAICFFHQETMKEALVKARSFSDLSKFRSLMFSLTEKNFNDLSETLNNFATRVKVEHCNDFIEQSRLYKLNFQLYPVTDLIEEKKLLNN